MKTYGHKMYEKVPRNLIIITPNWKLPRQMDKYIVVFSGTWLLFCNQKKLTTNIYNSVHKSCTWTLRGKKKEKQSKKKINLGQIWDDQDFRIRL